MTRHTPPTPTHAAPGSHEPLAWLDAGLRRQAVYLHLQDLVVGRDVVEVWSGVAEARGAETLLARGARRVQVVASGSIAGAGQRFHHVAGDPTRTGLANASAEVVLALEVEAAAIADVVREARRILVPDGVLVLGVVSRDRPGATGGASYYDVVDACGTFPRVRMVGVAPFAGTTLVEYGVKDAEPILDGTLVARGERVEHYLAIAGPDRRGDFGYGVVQVPVAAVAMPGSRSSASPIPQASGDVSRGRAEQRSGQADLAETLRVGPASSAQPSDALVAELRATIERHALAMRARETELAERDAYIAELERDGRRVHELEGRAAAAEAERAEAARLEREARRVIAELQGRAKTGAPTDASGGTAALAGAAPAAVDEVAVLKKKLADAEAESWKHMKARSEVEAASAELREDTVRKLKDARKLASVELTRAMEEATKKAVGLRDELTRSENERKAAQKALSDLRAAGGPTPVVDTSADPSAQRRELARAREEAEAAALAARASAARSVGDADGARMAAEAAVRDAEERSAQARGRLVGVERALVAAERERDEARALLAAERLRAAGLATRLRGAGAADVSEVLARIEEDAATRGRQHADRERLFAQQSAELERLRAELAARESRLAELERERPPRAEVERLRGELEPLRARLAAHTLEVARRDAAIERAAASAAHERARSERLVADERQALAERNDARARAAEAVARVAGIEAERERVVAALSIAEARAHKADNEVKEKRERIRQIKRELEDAERRADIGVARTRALVIVRARVQALETAVAGEAARVASIEGALRSQ